MDEHIQNLEIGQKGATDRFMARLKNKLQKSPRGNFASNSTFLTDKLPVPPVKIAANTFFSPRTLGMTQHIGHDSVSHRRKMSFLLPAPKREFEPRKMWQKQQRHSVAVTAKQPYKTRLKDELLNSPQAASVYFGPARATRHQIMMLDSSEGTETNNNGLSSGGSGDMTTPSVQNSAINFFKKKKQQSVTVPKQRPPRGKTDLSTLKTSKGARNGVLLLSNYRPNEFGNANIDLTVDGGQHHRSPGDSPPKITHKHVESIFKDPVFDHKPQLRKLESRNRRKVVSDIQSSMERIETKLTSPGNFKKFFWANNLEVFGFGTPGQIKATREHLDSEKTKYKYY